MALIYDGNTHTVVLSGAHTLEPGGTTRTYINAASSAVANITTNAGGALAGPYALEYLADSDGVWWTELPASLWDATLARGRSYRLTVKITTADGAVGYWDMDLRAMARG